MSEEFEGAGPGESAPRNEPVSNGGPAGAQIGRAHV